MLYFNGIISKQLQHEQSNSQPRTLSKEKIRVNSSAVVLQVTPWLAGRVPVSVGDGLGPRRSARIRRAVSKN